MTELVSIVLPFRNEERWLREALLSLKRQTHRNFEAVLVNDCSTDRSLGIAREFERDDDRFRTLDARGSGLVNALNTGLAEARGDWVARFDADDRCHPERIALQLELAARLGPRCVVSCLVKCFPLRTLSRGYRRYEGWMNSLVSHEQISRDIFVESPLPHPGAFFHRESVISEGGYRDLGLPEDYELWLRLWSRGYRFEKVGRNLLAWMERPDRYSRRSRNYSLNSFYRTKAMYLAALPLLRGRRVLIAGSGQTAKRLSRYLVPLGFEIEAFLCADARHAGGMLRGKPVAAPERLSDYAGIPVIAASRELGARARIRAFLENAGLREGRDFVVCA